MASLPQIKLNLETNPKLSYLPALDGLRALAVLAVMLYHFESRPLFPGGGLVGVDLFFVLSGFLITTLLLQEWVSLGDISLFRFYQRRILRLMPAVTMFLLIFVTVTIALPNSEFTGREPPTLVIRNAIFVAAYCLNWLVVAGGHTIPIGHLWSLSVEEQFYIAWPLVLLTFLRLKTPPFVLLTIVAGIIALSALEPVFVEGDRSRFYFGTDYRLQTLLAGGFLALLYVSGILRSSLTLALGYRLMLSVAAVALLGILLVVEDKSTFLFAGGHSAVALCSCIVIIACMFQQETTPQRVLSHSLLTYVGQRSYALYIWHFPISFWLRSLESVPQVILAFALTFAAAELSYRLVESPALRLKSRLGKPNAVTAPASATLQPESNPNAAA